MTGFAGLAALVIIAYIISSTKISKLKTESDLLFFKYKIQSLIKSMALTIFMPLIMIGAAYVIHSPSQQQEMPLNTGLDKALVQLSSFTFDTIIASSLAYIAFIVIAILLSWTLIYQIKNQLNEFGQKNLGE